MPSPLDVLLRNTKNSKVVVWRVLHDAQPHPGDFWPNKLFIRYFLRSSNIITLSDYVSRRIGNIQVFQTNLYRNVKPKFKAFTLPDDYVLIAGRAKKYKNIDEIIRVTSSFPDQTFVIMVSSRKTRIESRSNVVVIERWLEDAELEFAIAKAKAVIAAHTEASQSGIIEQAVYWNVPVLVSNRGGLAEQIANGVDGIVIEDTDSLSIADGLKKLLFMQRKMKEDVKKLNLAQSIIQRSEFSRSNVNSHLP
jgi:glycosyltransferase involved in cell wall biosynthesis